MLKIKRTSILKVTISGRYMYMVSADGEHITTVATREEAKEIAEKIEKRLSNKHFEKHIAG